MNPINYNTMKHNIITLTFISLFLILNINSVKAQSKVTLDEALQTALENSPAIKVAKSEIDVSEAKIMQAKSTLYPKFTSLTKYFYTNNLPGMYSLEGVSVPVLNNGAPTGDNIVMHPMAPYPILDRDVFQTNFNLIYPIYAGGKRVNAVQSTEKLKEAYTNRLMDTKSDLTLKVKTVYYNILFLDEVIDLYNQILDQLNQHLALADTAYNEGVKSEFDILNFRSKIEEFKSKIVELQGKKTLATTGLKNLMALPDSTNISVVGNLDLYINKPTTQTINIETIKTGNNKAKSLQSMKEALQYKRKIVAAGNLPTLFSFGNYHILHGMDFPPFDKTWRNGYAVGVGLKIDLFDGNSTKAKTAEIEATLDKIKSYQEGINLQLRFEYNKAIENIQSLNAQKTAHQSHLSVAQKAYNIAEISYQNGIITSIALNDVQLDIFKAKLAILKVDKDILQENAKLEYLSGK